MSAPGRAAGATGRWVSAAGCWMRESTPPSDTACVNSSTRSADPCRLRVSAAELDREHRSRASHLPAHEPGRVALGRARVEHAPHRGVLQEPRRDLLRRRLLRAHPHRKGGQPAVQQVGSHRVQDAPGHRADPAQGSCPRLVAGHDAPDRVPVAAQVLGGAVQDQCRAVVRRVLQHRRRERVVDQHRAPLRRRHDGRDVDQLEGRVGWCLEHDEARVRAQRAGHLGGSAEAGLDAEQTRRQEVVAPAVERPDGHDMRRARPAGLAVPGCGRQDGGRHGRHPGGEGDRLSRVLEGGEGGLEARHGGVPEPGVDVAPVGRVTAARHGLVGRASAVHAGQWVRRGQVERRRVHP